MSAVLGSYTYEMDASYAADFSRDREPMKKRSRHPEYRRKGSAPTRVNGMHCRRNKRWTWGSGRGARMTNLRAFAGCLAMVLSVLASAALAAPLSPTFPSFVTVGNPGNSGKVVGSGTYGSVAQTFQISQFETTNAQYVQFLNAVASSTSVSNLVYSTSMASDANGGITRSGSPGSYTYAVRTGSNAAGVPYASAPVNFTNWFSAARYVNWLASGTLSGPAGASAINGGFAGSAYNLSPTQNSGAIVSRNANATFWLPSVNEAYKAAFYNGSGYNTWATASGTATPGVAATTAAASGTNVATYGSATGTPPVRGPLPVDAFTNSQSPYGVYGLLGNVTEMTDTNVGGGSWGAMSGSWATTAANLVNFNSNFGALGSPQAVGSTALTAQIGFRVATVAPVPEPETITLAAFGIVGLCGANWMRRRRKSAAPAAEMLAA